MDTEFPQAPPQRRRAHRFWNGILTGCLSGGERAACLPKPRRRQERVELR